jgi:hypothetical protein
LAELVITLHAVIMLVEGITEKIIITDTWKVHQVIYAVYISTHEFILALQAYMDSILFSQSLPDNYYAWSITQYKRNTNWYPLSAG